MGVMVRETSTMGRWFGVVGGLACVLAAVGGDEPPAPAPAPADFKIDVGSFGASSKPVSTAQIVAKDGRTYLFSSDSNEVVIVEPKRAHVELLDIPRRIQVEITFAQLAESRTKLKAALVASVEKRESKGGRSNTVLAQMTRDMIEPRFRVEGDAKAGHFRLVNPTVEVDVAGESDPDAARLDLVATTMVALANLGAFRVPGDLPPFPELDAIAALAVERRLRPTELSFLFRLAGPPVRLRRTYRLTPSLTDREVEAIDRVDRLREVAPFARTYERYLKPERPRPKTAPTR